MKQPELIHVKLTDHVTQIGDSVGNACTLVTGSERALLFDAMSGSCDLRSYVETLTDLPLTVVISHGHFDHICGAWQYCETQNTDQSRPAAEVYLHSSEIPVFEESLSLLPGIVENTGVPLPEELMTGSFCLHFRDLCEGDLFDLGGLTAEAVSLPGHSAGSMGLLLREERILLVGDAVSPQMCLFFPVSLPMETYLKTLDKVETLPADYLLGSHFMKMFPLAAVSVFRECALNAGKKRGMSYVFTPVPKYRGTLWVYRLRDELTDETVCIITP